MAALTGPSFGSWAKIVTSRLTGRQPGWFSLASVSRQEQPRVGVLPARVGVGVGVADVAEAGGAEQGVGDGVQHHVGVGVADQPARVLDRHAAEDQRPALDQAVRVVPGTNADHGGFLGYSRLSRFY